MKETSPNQEWINQIRQRNPIAVKRIYTECYLYCIKFVIKMGADKETAHELFSQAVEILYNKIITDPLLLTCTIKTFLCAVMRNLWLAQLKSNKKFTDLGEQYDNLPDLSNEDLEEKLYEEEQIKEMKIAITELSPRCEEILTKFYIHRKKLDELVQELDITKAALKVSKTRCLKKLQEKLAK